MYGGVRVCFIFANVLSLFTLQERIFLVFCESANPGLLTDFYELKIPSNSTASKVQKWDKSQGLYIEKYIYSFYFKKLLLFLHFKKIWPSQAACGLLVPYPRIEPMTPASEAWNLNHWIAREVPIYLNCIFIPTFPAYYFLLNIFIYK